MVQLILLILGLIYWRRRPRLACLVAADFPDTPAADFEKWRRLELRSIDIFLWTAFGLAIGGCLISALLSTVLRLQTNDSAMSRIEASRLQVGFYVVYGAVFLLGLFVSALYGSKASRLKRSLGISWPPRKPREPS